MPGTIYGCDKFLATGDINDEDEFPDIQRPQKLTENAKYKNALFVKEGTWIIF